MHALWVVAVGALIACCVGRGGGSTGAGAAPGLGLGGWRPPPAAHLEALWSSECDFPRLGPAAWAQYRAQHGTHPVVLINVSDNTLFRELTSRDTLLDRFGDTEVVLSSANAHSYGKLSKTLGQYVGGMIEPSPLPGGAGAGGPGGAAGAPAKGNETFYLFGDNDYDVWTNFTEHYVRPPYAYEREPFYSFGIGGSGSGVPFHTHGAVFAEVLFGHKRWFVTPPELKPVFDPDATAMTWLLQSSGREKRRARGIQECLLAPGEILYLDTQWYHATLNIGDSVFISVFV